MVFPLENYSLHISSNPLIVCVNLQVLEFLDVRISHEEVLHNLLSTCKLLEKINLILPEGLNKLKLNNLLYLQELKIAPSSPCDDASLEIHDIPRLCSLFYDTQMIHSMPELSIIDSIGSLREMNLSGVTIDDYGFCDIINTKFPILESLTLDIIRCRVEILDIRSNSLQRLKLSLSNLWLQELHAYAPKLLSFQYKGFSTPNLFFPTIVLKQIELYLVMNKSVNHLFFLKLREYLNLSSKCNIVIRSFEDAFLVPFNIDDVRTRILVSATNVEKLSFETFRVDGLLENSELLFDSFFLFVIPCT